jgi:uncharacterized protein (UPF0276 family)
VERMLPAVGLVYHPELAELIDDLALEVVEVAPHALRTGGRARTGRTVPRQAVDDLAAVPEVLVCGETLPVASRHALPASELRVVAKDASLLRARHVIQPLAFRRVVDEDGAWDARCLLPPAQTPEGVELAAARLRELAAVTGRPVAFETGVSYLQPRPWELSDGVFIRAVAEAADCGIAVDLHALWANDRNGRQPIAEVLSELPLERVVEIHVAGGHEHRGFWLDAHDAPTPLAVLDVVAALAPRCPRLRGVVFELAPAAVGVLGPQVIADELARIGRAVGSRAPWESHARGRRVQRRSAGPSAEAWERTLSRLVVGAPCHGALARELDADPGVGVLRELVWFARAGALARTLPESVDRLRALLGEVELHALVNAWLASERPAVDRLDAPRGFAGFLRRHGHDEVAALADGEL